MPSCQVRFFSRWRGGFFLPFLQWAGFLCCLFLYSQAHAQSRLSFISERDGNCEVYLIAADGRSESRLTHDAGEDYNGPVTPDGKRIVVTRGTGPENQRQFQFYLYPLPGVNAGRAAPQPLGKPRAVLRSPMFTADGRTLLFESESTGLRDLFTIDLLRGDLRQLTNNQEGNFSPVLSQRDRLIAFTSSRDRVSEVYRMRPGGSDVRRLTYSAGSKWSPQFSPDGRSIFFVSDRDGAELLYRVDSNGSQPRRLTRREVNSAVREDQPSISPDGSCVAFTLRTSSAPARLHILRLQTGEETELPTPPTHAAGEPVWAPLGRSGVAARPCGALAFTLRKDDQSQIYLADAQRNTVTALTRGPGPNWHPLWIR